MCRTKQIFPAFQIICLILIGKTFGRAPMAVASTAVNIEEIFKQHQVVPDVIPSAPKNFLKVTYKGVVVENGIELTPTQVATPPTVEWDAEGDAFYLLVMTDPDAPSRKDPRFREFHHWLVANIPGAEISKGDVLTAYVGAGPPKGTGLHRYVFLIYKQPTKLRFQEPRIPKNSSQNRPNFSVAKFAKKHKLGDPIGGNFFQAEWDEYVPTVHKQLAGKK
ncbi:protein D2-like isoform X1 [Anastrepha obliqua]|uniref:protein D2-like isoform X1 n=2 Tax=Anastrepha obliqua TaxID=95512 RepID=UPI00240A4C61|nr:protein D2-like isoform X1 [Anastrepha obliqua]